MTPAERERRLADLARALGSPRLSGDQRRDLQIERAMVAGDLTALTGALGGVAIPEARTGLGDTLLQHAIGLAPVPFVRALLDAGCDVNYDADDGFPALVNAIHHEDDSEARRDLVRLLLDAGADLHRTGHNGSAALHIAALTDDPALVRLLLDAGADPDQPTAVDDRWSAEEEADHLGHTVGADAIRQWRAEQQP